MNIIQQQFFALLRAGLWGTEADASLFDERTAWEQIYRAARAQTLLGVVFDGVQTLPPAKRPPRAMYLQWCNALWQTEENNRLLNRRLAQAYELMRAQGIEPILLKGQGVAQNYRQPLHRQCGDIDLYIGRERFEQANSLLREEATHEEEESFKHTNMKWRGVTVENHRIPANLNAPLADWHLQRAIGQWSRTPDACRRVTIDGYTVSVPPLYFDVVYILLHSTLHFLNEGIGLRQVCDWACLLRAQQGNYAREQVTALLRKTSLTEAAKVFGVIATRHLGLPAEALPVAFDEKDVATGEWLLDRIWQEGNFGQFNEEKIRRPRGYWKGKWHTLTRISKRCREMGRLAPAEARWYPVVVALHSIQMQWKLRTR